MTLRYHGNCVGTSDNDLDALHEMIDGATDISRRTFLKHVNREDLHALEAELGYANAPAAGLMMASDWHVSYHRSKWRGVRCYYFRHSAIEYYFTAEAEKGRRPQRAPRRAFPELSR